MSPTLGCFCVEVINLNFRKERRPLIPCIWPPNPYLDLSWYLFGVYISYQSPLNELDFVPMLTIFSVPHNPKD